MIPLSRFPFDARPDALASGRAGGAGSPRNICNPVVIICLIVCRHYIATCEKIFDKLQDLIETLYYSEVDADNPLPGELIEIGDALDRTEGLLKAWKKKTKLVNYKASPSDEQ